jgi:hypothetical protein
MTPLPVSDKQTADLSGRDIYCRGSAAARLLRLQFRIPTGVWMSFSCESFVLSGKVTCDGADPSSRGVLASVCVIESVQVQRSSSAPTVRR